MNLGNIFQSRNQNVNNTDTAKTGSTSSGERSDRIQAEIRNYTPGQKYRAKWLPKMAIRFR